MTERTERSEGHEGVPQRYRMTERTVRSEGHEGVRSEGHRGMPRRPGAAGVAAVAAAAVRRRRLQTGIVGMVVLLTAATSVIALGLLAVSHAPFDAAFARAAGAQVGVTVAGDVPAGEVAATSGVTGVTAAAGPFDEATAAISRTGGSADAVPLGITTLAGRSTQDGPVDRLSLDSGHWLTGPGQIVLSREVAGPLADPGSLGTEITLTLPGTPTLRLVGVADSITGTAGGWVWPTETGVLHAAGATTSRQMLYRFASAGSTAAVSRDLAAVTGALPPNAVTGSSTWLAARQAANRSIAAFVPFVIAFAVLGLVLSVLITANIVNGAVVSGLRTIGVLKTLGFTPGQVVATYVAQVIVPALVGGVAGVAGGVGLAAPLLAQTQRAYNLPANVGGVPVWVMAAVAVGAPLLVAGAALGPALRAGRLAANEAITMGRAPRSGRGFRPRRALAATRLPRVVAFGLGMPLARPARAAGTVVAIMLGAGTLVFAVGLTASLARVHTGFTRVDAVPVVVHVDTPGSPAKGGQPVAGPDTGPATENGGPDPAAVRDTIAARPGTAHVAGVTDLDVRVAGVTAGVTAETYTGDARWAGFSLVSGRWYAEPGEVVASSYLLRQAGHHIGDRITVAGDRGQRTVTVVGAFLDGRDAYDLVADATTMAPVAGDVTPEEFEVGLRPGHDAGAYAGALQQLFPLDGAVFVDDRTVGNDNRTFVILDALIATLTVLLCAVAALGVLNTVVLNTRERIHDIGVLKAIGMTPAQLRTMVVSSMVGLGIVAGVLAAPAGVALHHWILPAMGHAADTDLPRSIIAVYGAPELLVLAAAGAVLAAGGALLPAGWAARARAANALRAE
jgi:putative ABC transport system permease protein